MTLSQAIFKYEALHIYSFSKDEIGTSCDISDIALSSALRRLKEKGEIVNLRKGFYIIVPPKYRLLGQLPLELYVNKMFQWLEKPYYISLLSAASYHGASHHALQKDFIMVQPPALRNISQGSYNIDFFTKKMWPNHGIITRTSESGAFFLSGVALTLLDLINYQNKIGGINRISEIIQELSEDLQVDDLKLTIAQYHEASDIQRLAYLLEFFEADEVLTNAMQSWIDNQEKINTVKLTPGIPWNKESLRNRWRVNVNNKIDIEW